MSDLKSQLQRIKQALSGGGTASSSKPGKPSNGPTKANPMPNVQSASQGDGAPVRVVPGKQPQAAPRHDTRRPPIAAQASPVTASSASISLAALKSAFLTRQHEFREPAAWVVCGKSTQLAKNHRGRAKEIFIGFDFGTAYTKVAVGLLDKVFPVDWTGVLNTRSPYLLPTEYSALGDGRCYLGQHPRAAVGDLITGLKQSFIGTSPTDPETCRAAVFVGLALQYVRAWVFEHHGRKLGDSPLRWHLNIGIPSNGLEVDDRSAAYRRLASVAWSLSLLNPTEISYRQASGLLASLSAALPIDLVETDPVPEFVGQLAGYAQSAQRQSGLHAWMDVGGGTVDMVTFNIHHVDGDDTFPFFVPKVEPLGTYAMVANRFARGTDEAQRLNVEIDDLMGANEFAQATGISPADVAARDAAFSARITGELSKVLRQTRLKRYRQAPEWRHGVRMFLTGGGASLSVYSEAVGRSGLQEKVRLNRLPLPKHPRVDEFDAADEEYHRISVACGLATNRLSLGRIVPAHEMEDDSSSSQWPISQRPDRDELYAR